jgi:YjbE family integral membrane protein
VTFDAEFALRALSIVAIDFTVAGDNALVITLAVRSLPARQRRSARLGGTVGAVALRLTGIFVVTHLLRIPLLQLAGGIVLVWIAVKLVRPPAVGGNENRAGTSWWDAFWIVVVADAVMSLDNVLAVAAAAHGDFLFALFGVALSIPVVVWGSGLLAWLMNRYVWVTWTGSAILGYVDGEMILDDDVVERWLRPDGALRVGLPIALGAGVAALGWTPNRPRTSADAPRAQRSSR